MPQWASALQGALILSPEQTRVSDNPVPPLLSQAEAICDALQLEHTCSQPLQRDVRRAMRTLRQASAGQSTVHHETLEVFLKRVVGAIQGVQDAHRVNNSAGLLILALHDHCFRLLTKISYRRNYI